MRHHHHNDDSTHKHVSTFGCGAILIVGGILLALFSGGVFPAELRGIVFSWQALLVVLGIWMLLRHKFLAGVALIVIGKIFLLKKFVAAGYISAELFPDFSNLALPIVLIGIGLVVILRKTFHSQQNYSNRSSPHDDQSDSSRVLFGEITSAESGKDGFYKKDILFGGCKILALDQKFGGGDFNIAFGGAEIDLRNTNLSDGETILEANVAFGGLVILAPDDWNIVIKSQTLFGNFADKRPFSTSRSSAKSLIIKSSLMFGGGEIKSN